MPAQCDTCGQFISREVLRAKEQEGSDKLHIELSTEYNFMDAPDPPPLYCLSCAEKIKRR